jgi:hypothetical protein
MEAFMDELVGFSIAAAWLAIFGMLLWGVVSGFRRQLAEPGDVRLPLLRLLERDGFSVARVQQAVGVDALARAADRCASCAARGVCQAGLLAGWVGTRPDGCPNTALFERVRGLRERARP